MTRDACVALLLISLFAVACPRGIDRGIGFGDEPTWRFSQVAGEGDATRRASNRLVAEALRDTYAGTPRAIERIRRALQLDPTNPWAFLAMARERVVEGEPRAAAAALDQAEARLRAEGEIPPAVRGHLAGLRGKVRDLLDDDGAAALLLHEAAQLAPAAWADGSLDAAELR